MLPFSIQPCVHSDGLYLLEDGRYQLLSGGELAPLMTGPEYVVCERIFIDLMDSLGCEGFTAEPVTLFRRRKAEEIQGYFRLRIHRGFSSDQINDLDLDGDRLLLMDNSHLFCTPSIGNKLQSARAPYFELSVGLSRFGGAA